MKDKKYKVVFYKETTENIVCTSEKEAMKIAKLRVQSSLYSGVKRFIHSIEEIKK